MIRTVYVFILVNEWISCCNYSTLTDMSLDCWRPSQRASVRPGFEPEALLLCHDSAASFIFKMPLTTRLIIRASDVCNTALQVFSLKHWSVYSSPPQYQRAGVEFCVCLIRLKSCLTAEPRGASIGCSSFPLTNTPTASCYSRACWSKTRSSWGGGKVLVVFYCTIWGAS